MLGDALEIKTRVLGPENPATVNSMENVGNVLEEEDHHAEAEKLYREALGYSTPGPGTDAPQTVSAMNNLGNIIDNEGHHAEAEQLLRDSLEIESRVFGTRRSRHPKVNAQLR